MHVNLQSRRFSLAVVGVLAAVSGCPNPDQRLGEFQARVVDAPEIVRIDAPVLTDIPDINGTFYLAIKPAFAPSVNLEMRATVVLTPTASGADLDMSLEPLSVGARLPVGTPFAVSDVAVNQSGEFVADFGQVTVDGAANPVSGTTIVGTIQLHGLVRTTDLFCGDVTGQITSPSQLPLAGSVFGAIRVPPGTQGANLPPPVNECPAVVPPDAAPIDAALPDA